jgi:hypothetical protein
MSNRVALELFYGGAWHDLVADERLLVERPLELRRPGAESSAPTPASLEARALNFDDQLRPANPESPLYGNAGVNTPVRLTVNDVVRGHLQMSSFDAGETRDFRATPRRGKAWVDLAAAGLMQQINQNATRLDSPQMRLIPGLTNLTGFWPLEDQSGAPGLSNAASGGRQGTYGGSVTLGATERPGGAARAVTTGADGTLSGRFAGASGSGWQFVFACKLDDGVTLTAGYQELIRITDSIGRVWAWEVNEDSYAWRIYDSEGNTLDYQSTITGAVDPKRWIRHRLKVTVSGSTITYAASWYEENAASGLNTSKTFSGTSTGQPRSWSKLATVYTDGAAYSAVYAVSDGTQELQTGNVRSVFNGFRDERAGTRFGRIMDELGLDWDLVGDAGDTVPMGPQPAADLPEILREIRDTEAGLMFDARDALAVVMMTRVARCNQTPIAVSVEEMPARPREVTAERELWNIVTVKNRDGGEAILEDTSGAMGTATKGPYERTVNVNVADERVLGELASWWLNRGTLNSPRYPQVVIDLTNLAPSRVAELEAIDVGSCITIGDYRQDTIRLYVTSCNEVVEWPRRRLLTLACEADDIFVTGVYDATRYDSASTTLAAAAEIGQTSLSLTTAVYSDRWSTTALPYPLVVSGERMICTGMTAAAGTGPWTQTATVTRSANGVRKRLVIGDEVHIGDPGRYAMKGE